MMMAYKPKLIGLPPLVAGTRVCSTIDVFSMLLYAVVFDILFSLLRPLLKERILKPISVIACAGIYVFAQNAGLFHGYLYYELTRYPVAVELTKEITKTLPKQQYTIISTTDELYQVIETGFHEEWIDFLEKSSNRTYTIPTPYLFFFMRKATLRQVLSGSRMKNTRLITESAALSIPKSRMARFRRKLQQQRLKQERTVRIPLLISTIE